MSVPWSGHKLSCSSEGMGHSEQGSTWSWGRFLPTQGRACLDLPRWATLPSPRQCRESM